MSMTQTGTNSLAVAFIDGSGSWRWYLKIDEVGLYRWYLEHEIWTNLRAATRDDAENKLRRFVAQCISGELVIIGIDDPGIAGG